MYLVLIVHGCQHQRCKCRGICWQTSQACIQCGIRSLSSTAEDLPVTQPTMSATSAATANRMARNNVSSASVTASTSTQQVEDAQRQLVAMHHRLAATKRSLSEVSCGAALSVRCTNTAPPRCRHGLTADTRHHSQVVDEYRFVEEQVILLLPHCKSAMLCEAPTSANVFVLGCLQLRQLDQARKRVRFLCDLYAGPTRCTFGPLSNSGPTTWSLSSVYDG